MAGDRILAFASPSLSPNSQVDKKSQVTPAHTLGYVRGKEPWVLEPES